MRKGTERVVVLLVSFAVFLAGVWALFSDSGTGRTIVLWGSFSGLIALAARQTINKLKK